MNGNTDLVYDSEFVVDNDDRDAFEHWLQDWLEKASQETGVESAIEFESLPLDNEKTQYRCQLGFSDTAAFDEFIDLTASAATADLHEQFAGRVQTHSRTLRAVTQQDVHAASEQCLNCNTPLRGQYCANCGQRSRNRLISLWQLLTEAFGDLFELDSRLWRTVLPLLRRPGQLTQDYLQGRRARYMPPFRTYLVLSILFFVVATFNPQNYFAIFLEPAPPPTAEEIAAAAAELEAEKAAAREKIRELAEAGTIPADVVDELDDGDGLNINLNTDGAKCEADAEDLEEMPLWVQKRLTIERLDRICERLQIDDGASVLARLWDDIPLALIILLPLMALVLKVLYPLSRRYFVEHLLFFVHFHAFFFLVLTLQILLIRGASYLPIPEAIPILIVVASSFYIPVYLFVALRRVYAQGRLVTFAKYFVLLLSYITGLSLMLAATTILALFTV